MPHSTAMSHPFARSTANSQVCPLDAHRPLFVPSIPVGRMSAIDAPGYDGFLLTSAVDALGRSLQLCDGEGGDPRLRRLARTLEMLCQMVSDAPHLGDAPAASCVRTDVFVIAAVDTA